MTNTVEDFPSQPEDPSVSHARETHVQELIIRHAALSHERDEIEEETLRGYRGGRKGGAWLVGAARRHTLDLLNRIQVEVAGKSKKHDPVSPLLLWFVLLPLVADFMLVGLYLAVVFNVRLDAPGETPVEFLVTLVFAVIITAGVALALRWVAIRRRTNKTDEGTYRAAASDGLARLEMPMITLLLAGLAGVMLVRVVSDASDAGVALQTSWIIAVFLAFITAALNWIIFMIEFHDGSDETHELDYWGRQLKPFEKRRKDLTRQMANVETQLLLLGGSLPPKPSPGTSSITRLAR